MGCESFVEVGAMGFEGLVVVAVVDDEEESMRWMSEVWSVQ